MKKQGGPRGPKPPTPKPGGKMTTLPYPLPSKGKGKKPAK
jgi:hypothetical protein